MQLASILFGFPRTVPVSEATCAVLTDEKDLHAAPTQNLYRLCRKSSLLTQLWLPRTGLGHGRTRGWDEVILKMVSVPRPRTTRSNQRRSTTQIHRPTRTSQCPPPRQLVWGRLPDHLAQVPLQSLHHNRETRGWAYTSGHVRSGTVQLQMFCAIANTCHKQGKTEGSPQKDLFRDGHIAWKQPRGFVVSDTGARSIRADCEAGAQV